MKMKPFLFSQSARERWAGGRGEAGFSLAESIISIGIASTVLLSVVGLLAGTLGGAQDTKTETVAGMVARRMMAEARHEVQTLGAGTGGSEARLLVLDGAMQPLASSQQGGVSEGDFQNGLNDQRATFLARASRVPSVRQPGMLDLVITVETPAAAPRGERKVFRYVSLLSPY
jgi:type II secretory pathway pseudopilin PulG